MKKTYIYSIIFLLLCSCTGEFSPTENAFITLEAPITKCQQGTIDSSNPNILNVDFSWKIENGTFSEGEIVLLDRETEEELERKPITDIKILRELQVPLERGNWFKWQVEAKQDGVTTPIKSNIKEFYTELIREEGAPYPVIITEELNTSETIIFSWEHPAEDPQRKSLKYELYHTFGADKASISIPELDFKKLEDEFISSDVTKRVEISGDEFNSGTTHYFKVRSIVSLEGAGNLSSNTYFKFTTK